MSDVVAPRPILVTGSHRSGTTFVGAVLAAARGTAMVYEPFNPRLCPSWLSRPMPLWYLYVCPDNAATYAPTIERMLRLRYPLATALRQTYQSRKVAVAGRDWLRASRARLGRARPIVKDPFVLFSAPWLADRYDASVIVLVRHPAAFVSSVVRLGWHFDVRNFLDQPLLLRDLLDPYAAVLQALRLLRDDPIAEAVLLWRVLYGVVARSEIERPDFIIRRLEDIAANPARQFADLFARVDLPWNARAAAAVHAHTAASNVGEVDVHDFRRVHRNSQVAVRGWTHRLDADVVARVRELAGPEGAHYYPSDDDWYSPRDPAADVALETAPARSSSDEQEGPS